jgi:hypothetical protein
MGPLWWVRHRLVLTKALPTPQARAKAKVNESSGSEDEEEGVEYQSESEEETELPNAAVGIPTTTHKSDKVAVERSEPRTPLVENTVPA